MAHLGIQTLFSREIIDEAVRRLLRVGTGPDKKVAIVAVFSVISQSPSKKEDTINSARRISSSARRRTGRSRTPLPLPSTFVLNVADMTHGFDLSQYLSICGVGARFHQVGLPDHALPEIKAQIFMANGSSIGACHKGSRPECLAILKLAAEKKLHPMVETIPISENNCAEAVERVKNNKVRYRFTLTDYDKVFGKRD